MIKVFFYFESNNKGGYVGVLSNSDLVTGNIVSQNAGSTNQGIYYQVGGGGLNGAFARALGSQVKSVNAELKTAYDQKFGDNSWIRDSQKTPSPLPLTSLLVPVNHSEHVGQNCTGMMYSVGPILHKDGLNDTKTKTLYSQIYADAMSEIAKSHKNIDGFRITMLSSGIYRGNAPIQSFSNDAATLIINAVCAAIKAQPKKLGNLAILINTDTNSHFPKELKGFTYAAKLQNASFFSKDGKNGFSIMLKSE